MKAEAVKLPANIDRTWIAQLISYRMKETMASPSGPLQVNQGHGLDWVVLGSGINFDPMLCRFSIPILKMAISNADSDYFVSDSDEDMRNSQSAYKNIADYPYRFSHILFAAH